MCKYDHMFAEFPSLGYLFFTDFIYKPFGSWWSGSVRFQAFEASIIIIPGYMLMKTIFYMLVQLLRSIIMAFGTI